MKRALATSLLLALTTACVPTLEPLPAGGAPEEDLGGGEDMGMAPAEDMASPPEQDMRQPPAEEDMSSPPPTEDMAPECPGQARCGQLCTDLEEDPTNCGFCGRTCVIPNAEAACRAGECIVGTCADGFVDADRDPTNGCESENTCTDGAACMTSCGSEGATVCVDGEETCPIPAEQCNAVDDDCNDACDEGAIAGCRVGVHRSSGNGHAYSTDLGFASTAPYNLESQNYFWLYADDPGTGTFLPVFLCRKGDGKRFLTTSTNCEMVGAPELELGFWSTEPSCGAVPIYRMYHPPSNNHFYTLNAAERDNARDNLGYLEEGIAGYVWRDP